MKTHFTTFLLLSLYSSGCQLAKNVKPELANIDLDVCQIDVVELEGEHIIIEDAFVDMKGAFISIDDKGNTLYMRNGEWNSDEEPYFIAYSLKEKKVISKFGYRGSGPNEFLYPSLILSDSNEFIGHIFDHSTGKFFVVDANYDLTYISKYPKEDVLNNAVHFYPVSDSILYTLQHHAKNGWYIYKDTERESELIHNLALLTDVTFFYAYAGEIGFNLKKQRMMYAYKFFREIHLLDLEGNIIRKITGKDKNRRRSNDIDEWLDNPHTPMYYWGSFGTDNYFYIGCQEERVLSEPFKKYSLIEQYDWNGNVIRRIKLNKPYGSFCVDKEDNRLYLLSSEEDDPLYVFDLNVL